MGADLFLEPDCDLKAQELRNADGTLSDEAYGIVYGPEYYFRDSYNGSDLLWQLGMSWWSDISPKINNKGTLSHKNIQWFIDEVESRDLHRNGFSDEPDYFVEKKARLLKFLRSGLQKGKSIIFSV